MSCHYTDWFAEARQIGFELLHQRKRHSTTFVYLNLSCSTVRPDDRNPVLPIIPVIDEALGRLCYFQIGHLRGSLHSSGIGCGECPLRTDSVEKVVEIVGES